MDVRVLFNDGSAIDDSYFDDGFTKLIDRMNEMIEQINDEYDMEIEVIEE